MKLTTDCSNFCSQENLPYYVFFFFFLPRTTDVFRVSSKKKYTESTYEKLLNKALLMSTHDTCFCGEICVRKILGIFQ